MRRVERVGLRIDSANHEEALMSRLSKSVGLGLLTLAFVLAAQSAKAQQTVGSMT